MAKLGDFIGTLLSDAARARLRADLETLKLAEAYSQHELLRRLPVPRFRIPDISIEFPMIVEASPSSDDSSPGAFSLPDEAELASVLEPLLKSARPRLDSTQIAKLVALARATLEKHLRAGRGSLPLEGRAVSEAADVVTKAASSGGGGPFDDDALRRALRKALLRLLSSRAEASPQLEVRITSSEIKAHGDGANVVRMRLTITEDAYELVQGDEPGGGYSLVPE